MSKSCSTPDISWGTAYVVDRDFPDRLYGKLCEIIEAMGVSEKQETSIKNLISKTVWNFINYESVYISTDEHNEIRKNWQERQKSGNINPIS